MGVAYFHEHFTTGFMMGSVLILAACAYMAVNPVEQAEKIAPRGE
jgi:hypothetical protein